MFIRLSSHSGAERRQRMGLIAFLFDQMERWLERIGVRERERGNGHTRRRHLLAICRVCLDDNEM